MKKVGHVCVFGRANAAKGTASALGAAAEAGTDI